MTGYESKRAAAQDKLAQPAQEPVVCKHQWFRTGAMAINECRCINCGVWNTVAPPQPAQDKLEQAAFDAWWDTQPRLNETNPCSVDSFEYWAWEGWHAALAQPAPRPLVMQREWVDLTDEEIDKWAHELHGVIYAVMADLKEKNT